MALDLDSAKNLATSTQAQALHKLIDLFVALGQTSAVALASAEGILDQYLNETDTVRELFVACKLADTSLTNASALAKAQTMAAYPT